MFEIDKNQFGSFVAQLRKEKGLTQKDLAQKLYISDKAISKWERGISMPDVALLIPLSEALGVTVTELLQCQILDHPEPMDTEQVEQLVKAAITYTDEKPRARAGKRIVLLAVCILIAAAETAFLLSRGPRPDSFYSSLLVPELLSAVFAGYFLLLAQERLPDYYDQNKIQSYNDGFFKMNIPGLTFNNRNWPHIRKAGAIGTLSLLVGYPILLFLAELFLPADQYYVQLIIMLCAIFGGIFIPVMVAGKKYE